MTLSLYARAAGVEPASWEDPSLTQIWFRGGADYVIPREDIGVFTLGSLPRDAQRRQRLEAVADAAHRVLEGGTRKVREVADALGHEHPSELRVAASTGRLLIRWDASMIWLIPNERPDIDPEAGRLELARRFFRWLGPQPKDRLARWTGVQPGDATATWKALDGELVDVVFGGKHGRLLESDVAALEGAEPVKGVRLLPSDDPFLRLDHDLLVPDATLRDQLFPRQGASPGFIPGAVLVDGEITGVWQRQQRRVTIHPWRTHSVRVKDRIEEEALALPIAGRSSADVRWEG